MIIKRKFIRSPVSPLFVPTPEIGKPSAPGKKQVISNGEVLGEITATGDDLKDLEAADALLRSKGHKPPTQLERMYMLAGAFSATARDLFHRHLSKPPHNASAAIPFIVNAAFSIELYLKMLLVASSLEPARKHELLLLYDALPQVLRDEIHAVANELVKQHPSLQAPVDFRVHLSPLDQVFERWRYWYEHSSLGGVYIVPTMLVMHVLHDVAAKRARPPGT